jgi:hypothetical protein
MTATSELGYYVRRDFTRTLVGSCPTDTGEARALANNINHVADECGQVLVNWVAPTSGWAGTTNYFNWLQATTDTRYRRLMSFGVFPVRIRPDGAPYSYRCRLAVTSDAGAATVTCRLVVGIPGALDVDASQTTATANTLEVVTSSTGSPAWDAPASNIRLLTSAATPLMGVSYATRDSSLNRTAVTVPSVEIALFATSSSPVQGNARVHGVYVAEYVGT